MPSNLEWWNIVRPESLDLDGEQYDDVSVHGDSNTFLNSDEIHIEDFIDGSDLLEELRTLNDLQEASAQTAYSDKSDDKLFSNSQLSVKETVVLLLGIVTRHQLSGVALEDVLSFINLICPKENKMPKDAKEIFSFFQSQSQRIVKHFYCPNKKCQAYVGHTTLDGQESCSLCSCKLLEEAMFLEIPVQDQLKTVLSGKSQNCPTC